MNLRNEEDFVLPNEDFGGWISDENENKRGKNHQNSIKSWHIWFIGLVEKNETETA